MATWRLIAHHTDADTQIKAFHDLGCIAIGWSLVGDLRLIGPESAAEITPRVRVAYPESNNAHLGGPSLWRFYEEMRPGDFVILGDGSRRRAVMRVSGEYEFVPTAEAVGTLGYRHRRAAETVMSDPEHVWERSGAALAEGENVRWTLARCAERHPAP
jgi:predicted Mrr-cat superfamily restriction endonuclease